MRIKQRFLAIRTHSSFGRPGKRSLRGSSRKEFCNDIVRTSFYWAYLSHCHQSLWTRVSRRNERSQCLRRAGRARWNSDLRPWTDRSRRDLFRRHQSVRKWDRRRRTPEFQHPFCRAGFSRWCGYCYCRPATSGLIYGVAIGKTGAGIVGGIGPSNSAYAALIAPDGTLTPLAGLPSTGAIYWVSVNDSGEMFIGGQNGSSAYAAFVSPDGQLTPVAGLPAAQFIALVSIIVGWGSSGEQLRHFPMRLLSLPMEQRQ